MTTQVRSYRDTLRYETILPPEIHTLQECGPGHIVNTCIKSLSRRSMYFHCCD